MKVSVITSTYNRPLWLDDVISSFLSQNYDPKEMIIINNGSDGETAEVLKKYDDYDNINIIHLLENTHDSINIGIKYSTGDLICQLHDDDLFYDENSLLLRVEAFNDPQLDYVWTGYQQFGNKGKIVDAPVVDEFRKAVFMPYITMMWRKSIHEKIGYIQTELKHINDRLWKLKCFKYCKGKRLNFPTMLYRIHDKQTGLVSCFNGEKRKQEELFQKLVRAI
jgi:glycosyltransferase involved in cell wall biosynthesis